MLFYSKYNGNLQVAMYLNHAVSDMHSHIILMNQLLQLLDGQIIKAHPLEQLTNQKAYVIPSSPNYEKLPTDVYLFKYKTTSNVIDKQVCHQLTLSEE